MPELTPNERLQPALWDRLRDDAPDVLVESRDRQVISTDELYACVRRDMALLLNTANLESVQNLAAYPHVARSVLNFGIPDLCGKTLSDSERPVLESTLRKAILCYEPRIHPESLEVTVVVDQSKSSHRTLTIEIRGDLWVEPIPLEMLLRTELDLETGDATIINEGGN